MLVPLVGSFGLLPAVALLPLVAEVVAAPAEVGFVMPAPLLGGDVMAADCLMLQVPAPDASPHIGPLVPHDTDELLFPSLQPSVGLHAPPFVPVPCDVVFSFDSRFWQSHSWWRSLAHHEWTKLEWFNSSSRWKSAGSLALGNRPAFFE